MRILKRTAILLSLFVTAPALLAERAPSRPQASPAKSDKFALSVDSIMRGPDLVGYPPENLRWSADSQKLFFDWRKPGDEEASTYVVGRDGGSPVKLTDAQKKLTPPANGQWDRAHRRVLFTDRGDVVMIDDHGIRHQITRTTKGICSWRPSTAAAPRSCSS